MRLTDNITTIYTAVKQGPENLLDYGSFPPRVIYYMSIENKSMKKQKLCSHWTVEKHCRQNLECQYKEIYYLVEWQTCIFFTFRLFFIFKCQHLLFSDIELKLNKETSFLDIFAALPVSILPPIFSQGDNPWRGALIRYLFMVLQSKALICQGDSRQCRPRVRKK